jgi:hypothetical protein
MDEETIRVVKRAAATACLAVGLFLIVAGGAGYIAASQDPVHTTGDQVALIAVGIGLTAAGRIIPH